LRSKTDSLAKRFVSKEKKEQEEKEEKVHKHEYTKQQA